MKLRVAWVGPWNVQSAIAQFGMGITQALVDEGHTVEIIRSEVAEAASLAPRPTELILHEAGALSAADIQRRYDVVIVNLGNHYAFHGDALRILTGIDNAIAIFHDRWMGHFVDGWRHAAGSDVDRIDHWLAATGGDHARLTSLATLAPAAVVHARHYRDEVAEGCAGPVIVLPLSQIFPFHEARGRRGDRLALLTVGHANPNKRIDEVIRGIACHAELRSRVDYTVAGPIEPAERERLTRTARAAGVKSPRFTGWVSDEDLFDIVEASDVICCLRYPSTEGGSGSLLTAMLASRPTIVSDAAVYAEAPDDVVLKCPAGAEAAAVGAHLKRLMADPELRITIGRKAREHALSVNNVQLYARELAAYAQATLDILPLYAAARHAGRDLGRCGALPDDPAVEGIAKRLEELRG